jgi:NAD(P)H dehydrogenase (quinone)
MRTLIVFNHPYERSYCNAILDAVLRGLRASGQEVDLIHLDHDGFDPAMSRADLAAFVNHKPIDPHILNYVERIQQADHLIFIFPIWWDLMPAMTKGFIDRVLFPGVVYDHHPRGFGLKPLLTKLKGITMITTMNKPAILYSLVIGNLIRKAMLKSVFKTMGYKNLKWISFTSVKSVGYETRKKWLAKLEKQFAKTN